MYGKASVKVAHDSWDMPVQSHHDTAAAHPVPKSDQAWRVFVEAFSPAGALVYDAFMGSGTTAVVAEQTGRLSSGLELEPKYVAVTLQRLADLGLTPRQVSDARE